VKVCYWTFSKPGLTSSAAGRPQHRVPSADQRVVNVVCGSRGTSRERTTTSYWLQEADCTGRNQ